MRNLTLALSIIGALSFFSKCSSDKKEQPEFERATEIFTTTCGGCHGGQMQAFVDRKWKFGNSEEELYNTITKGNDSLGMPSFAAAYTEEELKELVLYIREGIKNVDEYKFQDVELQSDTFQTKEFSFHLDTILSGDRSYWGMAFLPKGEILVTEKSGTIIKIDQQRNSIALKTKISVSDRSQGGLLDIEVHPNFEDNHWVYFSYSGIKEIGGKKLNTTVVDRGELVDDDIINVTRIFEALPYSEKRHHYGNRLEFDHEGYLFLSVGDRGARDENPQSLASHCGKIHRINDDGSIPKDNPFVNQDSTVASIYSYGHRNPQGVTLHPETGKIWEHEHGPRGGDELNIIEAGLNYGWPIISYGLNYNGTTFTNLYEKKGLEQPIHYWTPSIAPCGMDFVTGDRYSGWENQLLTGSLRFKYLNLTYLAGNKVIEEERLMENIGRVRNVKMSPDGYIYVAVEREGAIYKLVPIVE